MEWIKKFQDYAYMAILAVGIVVWAFTTFATASYVNEKHNSVVSELRDIKDILDRVDQRVYELNRRAK